MRVLIISVFFFTDLHTTSYGLLQVQISEHPIFLNWDVTRTRTTTLGTAQHARKDKETHIPTSWTGIWLDGMSMQEQCHAADASQPLCSSISNREKGLLLVQNAEN